MNDEDQDQVPANSSDSEEPNEEAVQKSQSAESKAFDLKLSTSVLYDLGINLYSSIPAVLSEIVANSWDADAPTVSVTFDETSKQIVIEDDGNGMNEEDVRTRYLQVGYKKRRKKEDDFTVNGRKVLGRKGIGKLAPLAIANEVELHTTKDGDQTALRFSMDRLAEAAEKDETYHPDPIAFDTSLKKGTRLVLKDLRKGTGLAPDALRKRVARRFNSIGKGFKVVLNGHEITPKDREYLSKLQLAWCYGDTKAFDIQKDNPNIERAFDRSGDIGGTYRVSGWMGTVARPDQLKLDGEVLNKVVVFVGGKVAHEDLLYNVSDARVYNAYLVGELEADFLDEFAKDDIATSNRQGIIEDDSRFRALLDFIKAELKVIRDDWSRERSDDAVKGAMQIPALQAWYDGLQKHERDLAKRLIGKINQVPISDSEKPQYYKYAVLAFESLKVRDNLDRIDEMTGEDLHLVAQVFAQIDDIEATHFYEITRRRLSVIEQLDDLVAEDVKEKVLQNHIAKHLWLVDPSWDYLAESAIVERDMKSVIDGLKMTGDEDEVKGRVDIQYSKTYGRHVVLELKRYGVKADFSDLVKQILKYKMAIEGKLRLLERSSEPLEIVILLGKEPSGTSTLKEANESLAAFNARIVLYNRLIDDAQKAYREYLDKSKDRSRILNVIRQLEDIEVED